MKVIESDIKLLKKIAKQLPYMKYCASEATTMLGEHILLGDPVGMGFKSAKDVDPKKEYNITRPSYHEVNHFKRLKKRYQKGGIEAVDRYIKKVKYLAEQGTNILPD